MSCQTTPLATQNGFPSRHSSAPVVATASISIKLVSDALGGADVVELVQGKDDLLAIVNENVVKTLEPNFSLLQIC